jgi:hypothetical protein
MFQKTIVKVIACIVVVAYISVFNAGSVFAVDWKPSAGTLQFLAQASNSEGTGKVAAEEQKALRQIYAEKIQRLESDMNKAKGTRNTLLTVAVSSLFIGAGLVTGSTTVTDAVKEISAIDEQDKEDALNAIDTVKAIGGGILGVGGLSLLGYLFYTVGIGSKQNRIDKLRTELDTRFEAKGLTPEYLQRNESVAAVLQEIEAAKKSAGSARTFQSFLSRIGIGSVLSGGFLYALALGGRDVVKKVNVTQAEIASRDDALDKTDRLKTTGIILLGVGAASSISSFLFGRRASGKDHKIDELENGLLRVAERIDIRPHRDGFMVMYTHEF